MHDQIVVARRQRYGLLTRFLLAIRLPIAPREAIIDSLLSGFSSFGLAANLG